jgi:Rrf2 family nitric oxide-sensitive transcriptional repressor
MRFSLSTQFCLRILAFAASVNRKTTTREIAQFYGLPLDRVRKAARRLGRMGYLATERGQTGGLRLSRPANEVTLGPVVRQLETAAEARDNAQPGIYRPLTEALRSAVEEAEVVFWQKLDHVTLAELANSAAHKEQHESQRAA